MSLGKVFFVHEKFRGNACLKLVVTRRCHQGMCDVVFNKLIMYFSMSTIILTATKPVEPAIK